MSPRRKPTVDPFDKGDARANPCRLGSHGFCLHTSDTCTCSCHSDEVRA